jgi:hypothetical protein
MLTLRPIGKPVPYRAAAATARAWKRATPGVDPGFLDASDLTALLQTTGTWDAAGATTGCAAEGTSAVNEIGSGAAGPVPGGTLVARWLAGTNARYVTVAGSPLPAGGRGALVLLNSHRSLFSDDDLALFGALGGQAAIIADRQALTADRYNTVRRHSRLGHRSPIAYENTTTTPATLASAA